MPVLSEVKRLWQMDRESKASPWTPGNVDQY
ncbi:rCG62639 [Rattus norvegicus]|uniref:RCG62639 n=1 Tax=Rattus norvegicus TaxID=10116 RepID=A6J6E6_RAT|nr:rCG62639 [Rattus norvegicus]